MIMSFVVVVGVVILLSLCVGILHSSRSPHIYAHICTLTHLSLIYLGSAWSAFTILCAARDQRSARRHCVVCSSELCVWTETTTMSTAACFAAYSFLLLLLLRSMVVMVSGPVWFQFDFCFISSFGCIQQQKLVDHMETLWLRSIHTWLFEYWFGFGTKYTYTRATCLHSSFLFWWEGWTIDRRCHYRRLPLSHCLLFFIQILIPILICHL